LHEYLYLLLNNENFWPKGGTAQPFVQTGLAQRELTIHSPPLAEQQRIVAKVKLLLARVNEACARLFKVPAILKRFRQSILAAVCSGQLTADWRDTNFRAEFLTIGK
jgi:type I restriction enzyme, S subunit